jgi:CheY-like chemotaxis protein
MAVAYNLTSQNINIKKEAVNGLEVLQYIQSNSNIKLDFILLDLDMPIMNGFEACRQIIDFYENSNIFKLEKPIRAAGEKKDSSKSIAQSVSCIIEELFC